MRTGIAISTLTLLVALSACKSNQHDWVMQIGGGNNDSVFGIARTSDGRACVTGTFVAESNFGNEAHPVKLDSGGYSDIFVACYTADGTPVFATGFGVTGKNDQPRAIAALPGGDVLITGFFSRTFGSEPAASLQTHGPGNADVFLARVDSQGKTVWSRRFGGAQADSGRALAVAADGSILLAGSFQELLPYVEDGIGHKLPSAGSRDAFVFRLDSTGQILWGRRFGGTRSDEAHAVTVTADGTVVVAGTFAGAASGDNGATFEAAGYDDAFVQAFSADGEPLWTRAFGGTGQEYVTGLVAGDAGEVWLAGSFQREITLANGVTLASRGSTDGLLVRFDAEGNIDRALSFGGPDVELVYAIARAADGTLLLTGHFQNDTDLAPGPAESIYSSSGTNDTEGFVLVTDRDGNHRHAIVLGGDDVAVGSGVIAGPGQSLAVTGIFGKTMRVGIPGAPVLTSYGKSDVFIVGTTY